MPLCIALFFTRTMFIGYKYLFFVTFVPCFLYSVYVLFKQGVAIPKFKTLLLPILVIALFFAHFSLFGNVVKESVNIALIVYFFVFATLYYADGKLEVFLKWIVRLALFAGCIAMVRFVLSKAGVLLPLLNILFEGGGFSLVNDYNFYSLFFIITLVISFRLFITRHITPIGYVIVYIISLINIVAAASRRGYVLFVLIIVLILILSIYRYHRDKKKLMISVLPMLFLAFCLVGIFSYLSGMKRMDMVFVEKCYKLQILFDKDISFEEFYLKLRMKLTKKHRIESGGNLFYNGDLRYGLLDWENISNQPACISFMLVGESDKAIRVSNSCEIGGWQVYYAGRPIFYHKDRTYDLSFTYRVLAGQEKPFNVGWWVYEKNAYRHALPQKITPIDSAWNRCEVSYKFLQDHLNSTCFINSLDSGAIIEVKDICLTCDDTTNLPMYVDQLPDSVIHGFFKEGGTIKEFTAPRTDRWRYALELWQTRYNAKQKIFGQGFKYLEWYGEKFYNNPNRHDFPHNPIISSFLYSGIIGGVVYIIFLIMSLWLYWKRRKELGLFFIMYLCCMFFSMFSGSSHFSFPLFAFLSFLPFVEVKEKAEPYASSHASATCNCD